MKQMSIKTWGSHGTRLLRQRRLRLSQGSTADGLGGDLPVGVDPHGSFAAARIVDGVSRHETTARVANGVAVER